MAFSKVIILFFAVALAGPGTAAPQSFYGAPYLDQRPGRTLSSFLGFGSKTNTPPLGLVGSVPAAATAGTVTAPVALPPVGPGPVNLGKVEPSAPVTVVSGPSGGGGGVGPFVPSAFGAPSIPVAKPVLRSPLQPPPAAPPRPILYNIRFYPDLSFEQSSPDRVKDRVPAAVYSILQGLPNCLQQPLTKTAEVAQDVVLVKPEMVPSPAALVSPPAVPAPTVSTPVVTSETILEAEVPSTATTVTVGAPSLPVQAAPSAFTTTTTKVAQPFPSALPPWPNALSTFGGLGNPYFVDQQPYAVTQEHGTPNVFLPVLQAAAAAAAVSQQHHHHHLGHFLPSAIPYYQTPFPYFSQPILTSAGAGNSQQVSSQKLAPSVYSTDLPYYHYGNYGGYGNYGNYFYPQPEPFVYVLPAFSPMAATGVTNSAAQAIQNQQQQQRQQVNSLINNALQSVSVVPQDTQRLSSKGPPGGKGGKQ